MLACQSESEQKVILNHLHSGFTRNQFAPFVYAWPLNFLFTIVQF
jgi:hypothetical protein